MKLHDLAIGLDALAAKIMATPIFGHKQPPAVPSGLVVNGFTSTSISLDWLDNPEQGVTYKVYRSQTGILGSFGLPIATPTPSTYNDTGRASATLYYYYASSVDSTLHESAASASVSQWTIAGQVTGLTATADTSSITLSWTAATGTITGYKVYRSATGGAGTFTFLANSAITSYPDVGLGGGAGWFYYVDAISPGGEGAPSSTVSATTTSSLSWVPPTNPLPNPVNVVQGSFFDLAPYISGSPTTITDSVALPTNVTIEGPFSSTPRATWRLEATSFATVGASTTNNVFTLNGTVGSTQGFRTASGRITDSSGTVIPIRGIAHFGFGQLGWPQYLWQQAWRAQLDQIKALGFTAVRCVVSPYTIHGTEVAGGAGQNPGSVSPSINPDLIGKTPIQALDLWMAYCATIGLYVMFDMHSIFRNSQYQVWYTTSSGQDTWNGLPYSKQNWIDDCVFLVTRYTANPYLIAFDVYNEPNGVVRWDSGDANMTNAANYWRPAVEDCGAAILAANPKVIIGVQGVGPNFDGQENGTLAAYGNWGEDLMPQAYKPLNVAKIPANKTMFLPHTYGPEVSIKPSFNAGNFPTNLAADWQANFGYLSPTFAVIPGEWGGQYGVADAQYSGTLPLDSHSKPWMDAFVAWMGTKNMHDSWFWAYTPNSGDVGGILDSNLAVRQDKLALLQTHWGTAAQQDWVARSTGANVVWAHDFSYQAEVDAFNDHGATGTAVWRQTDGITGATGKCLEMTVPAGGVSVGGWARPFSRIAAVKNGLPTNDLGANGTLPLRSDWNYTAGVNNSTPYSTWMGGAYVNATYNPNLGGTSVVNPALTAAQVDGGDFWIQMRVKYSALRWSNTFLQLNAGTARGGSGNTITLATSASVNDDAYIGCRIRITSGTGAGQTNTVREGGNQGWYVGSTRVATMDSNWSVAPNATSVYVVDQSNNSVSGKFHFISTTKKSNPEQELVVQSESSWPYDPVHGPTTSAFRLYTNNGNQFNSGLGSVQDSTRGGSMQPGGLYNDTCWVGGNPSGATQYCWYYPVDTWITMLFHIIPGHQGQGPDVAGSQNNGARDTGIQVYTDWNAITQQRQTSYIKIHDKLDFVWRFGGASNGPSPAEIGEGFNCLICSGFMNDKPAGEGWSQRWTQIIFAKGDGTNNIPIPCPQV